MEQEKRDLGPIVPALLVATALSFVLDVVLLSAGVDFNRALSFVLWLILLLIAVLVARWIAIRRERGR